MPVIKLVLSFFLMICFPYSLHSQQKQPRVVGSESRVELSVEMKQALKEQQAGFTIMNNGQFHTQIHDSFANNHKDKAPMAVISDLNDDQILDAVVIGQKNNPKNRRQPDVQVMAILSKSGRNKFETRALRIWKFKDYQVRGMSSMVDRNGLVKDWSLYVLQSDARDREFYKIPQHVEGIQIESESYVDSLFFINKKNKIMKVYDINQD